MWRISEGSLTVHLLQILFGYFKTILVFLLRGEIIWVKAEEHREVAHGGHFNQLLIRFCEMSLKGFSWLRNFV